MNNIKTEKWFDNDVRFVEIDNEWYGVCSDICKALELNDADSIINDADNKFAQVSDENTLELVVSEIGIYKALFLSDNLEAFNFRTWSGSIMKKLRKLVGLEGYEVFKMTDVEIQKKIDNIIDTLYYDESTDQVMISITVAGGDVEQIPLYSE